MVNYKLRKEIFIVSPIGKINTEKHEKYISIYNIFIKPVFKEIKIPFKIIRADDITKPGSFLKDIIVNLKTAYIVIANISEPNPNVYYELGVRHALSNRTILITENIASIPSDLMEYRVIEYKADITGIQKFHNDLKKTILEILQSPDEPDNPVSERLNAFYKKENIITWNDSILLAFELIEKIKNSDFIPDIVFGLGRSGGIWGGFIAGNLGSIPFYSFEKTYSPIDNTRDVDFPLSEEILHNIKNYYQPKNILIVEGAISNGVTIQTFYKKNKLFFNNVNLKTCVIYRNSTAFFKVDFVGKELKEWPDKFPWHYSENYNTNLFFY